MGKKSVLGEFEHHVLLAAMRLGAEAYSAAIVQELEEITGREVAPAAVYIALRRLEESGFARSEMRPPGNGGRPRRYFSPSSEGIQQMQDSRRRFEALWAGLKGMGDA